jgi:hypothetical protein
MECKRGVLSVCDKEDEISGSGNAYRTLGHNNIIHSSLYLNIYIVNMYIHHQLVEIFTVRVTCSL